MINHEQENYRERLEAGEEKVKEGDICTGMSENTAKSLIRFFREAKNLVVGDQYFESAGHG